MPGQAARAAPWRSAFIEHVSDMDSPTFVLSTLSVHPNHSAGLAAPGYTPRARTLVYRGMWASLPDNPKNSAPHNPDVYEADLVAFTTDARMGKVPELFDSASAGPRSEDEGYGSSGGGGPVEAVFWASKHKTQWRLAGRAYVLGPDIEGDSAAAKAVRQIVLAKMRRKDGDASPGEWSFAREITAHFGNLSPIMRGSFRNPPPGVPLSQPPEDERLKLGQSVTDLYDEVARANFRVVVVVPIEVDRVDLMDPKRGRRWRYRFFEEGQEASTERVGQGEMVGGWDVTELWP
jgi:pyridoxamine 5'-phosphate oxidase